MKEKNKQKFDFYNRKNLVVHGPLILILIVAVILAVVLLFGKGDAPEETQGTTTPAVETTQPSTEPSTEEASSTEPEETEPSTEEETTEPVTEEETEEETEPVEVTTKPEETTQPPLKLVTFPYTIPGTDIVLLDVRGMDGMFLEDGSDEELSDMCTLMLTNQSNKDIEYLSVVLDMDGVNLEFKITDIPSGGSAVAYELNKSRYVEGTYQNCTAEVAWTDSLGIPNGITVTENTDGSLTITNTTGETIPGLRVFYKYYVENDEIYIGGITYTSKVNNLEAGSSSVIRPRHYAKGYSKVVMVRVYDVEQ